MFNVNIYLETSISGPAVKEAAGVWWVECITGKSGPVFRRGFIWQEKTTENALALALFAGALGTLVKPCSVRVNTQCRLILNAMEKGWAERWEKAGWINAKGKPVGHKELWQRILDGKRMHLMGFDFFQNPYREEMLDGLEVVLESRGQADPWKYEKR